VHSTIVIESLYDTLVNPGDITVSYVGTSDQLSVQTLDSNCTNAATSLALQSKTGSFVLNDTVQPDDFLIIYWAQNTNAPTTVTISLRTTSSPSSGLTSTQVALIGVGVAVVAVGTIAFCFWRRRKLNNDATSTHLLRDNEGATGTGYSAVDHGSA